MSVGFRPTEADNEIIQAHKRPDESTSDVLRRALRALDRQKWQEQARADMDRITASSEDLSEEPDDWGYDEQGHPADLRGNQSPLAGHLRETDSDGALMLHVLGVADEGSILSEAIHEEDQGILKAYVLDGNNRVLALSEAMKPVAASMERLTSVSREPFAKKLPAIVPPLHSKGLIRQLLERDRPSSWRLAHLRATARRAGKR